MNNTDISKMNIYHFISGDLWAGAESMAFTLLSQLRNYPDLNLVVILLNEGKLAHKLREIGISVHVIDEKQYSFWEIVWKTRKIMRMHPPDLIHSHRYKENILAALSVAFNRNMHRSNKLIATQHGLPEIVSENGSLLSRAVSKINFYLLSKCFSRIVAVSTDVQKTLITQYAFRESSIESIHNGIELPDATLTRQNSKTFVIGSSGRLFPVKDYPLMVEVARSIGNTTSRKVHFELVGEGPERPVIESMVQRYGLQDCFTLKGYQDDMDHFYNGIDVYLNTSIHEGIPMTILEAIARGIPVIAPAVGGIGEIITNGVEGFLIESRNPEAFAEKCLLLQENRELRVEMSRAARDKACRFFSAESMAETYCRLYFRTRSPTLEWREQNAVNWAQ